MSNNGWLASKPCQKHEPCPGPGPKPEPGPKKGCCCNEDMRRALELLFDPTVRPAILSDQFAFIGKKFLVGTSLELVPPNCDLSTIGNDNTGAPSATLNSIDPCKSDFINITAPGYYYPIPTVAIDPPFPAAEFFIPNPVSKVSLCNLDAIIFNYNVEAVEDFKESLKALLDKKYSCHCFRDDECCCGNGIYRDIYKPYSFTENYVNISAGWLALYQAEVLGRVGNILVLANSAEDRYRIYFICLESVGFYGTEPLE